MRGRVRVRYVRLTPLPYAQVEAHEGYVNFTDLSVLAAGPGLRLRFASEGFPDALSPPFRAVLLAGP